MSSSIDFVRPIPFALTELKEVCQQVGILLTTEEEVNNGTGIKLLGTISNEPVAMVLYYNRGKGKSSKIVFEKIPEHVKVFIINGLAISKAAPQKNIPIHASFQVTDQGLHLSIKERLLTAYPESKEYLKPLHAEYLAKIISGSNEVTITQFSSGKLLIQGAYSDLVDRVVDIIDRVKPLSSHERALLYVP